MRVEPHPNYPDSVRITTYVPTLGPDPLRRAEGPDTMIVTVLGERCRGARAVEEGRMLGAGRRMDVTYRVICPAARGLPAS
jgi:hypothetical protein